MGKTIINHKKLHHKKNDGNLLRFKRKLLLLKHLKDTKFTISRALAQNILEEELRSSDEIFNDLEPSIIAEPSILKQSMDNTNVDSDPFLDTFSSSGLISTKSEPNQSSSGRTLTFLNNSFRRKKRIEYVIPTISDLEETGLKDFYDFFLNSAQWQISNLNVKPGDPYFIFWFMASSYIPLICSCSGPLSNVFSLLAIICPWKINKTNPSFEHDPFWCYLVNSISIIFALVSNIVLLLNYRKKIRYNYAQIISISGWAVACTILTSLIIAYHIWFYAVDLDKDYIIGEGFWFAILTVVLHFINFVMLLFNEAGFLLKKYQPVFNIDRVQETLIIQTTAMGVWLMVGASIFTRLLDVSLGDSFFYSIVSVVTVGAQGVVSVTDPAAQTVTSIWIIVGLVMFGLIVSSIREMMIQFSSSTLYWHRLECLRKELLVERQRKRKLVPDNETSFNLVKKIHRWAYTIQGISELTTSLIIFMITLMCGALAFALLESWPYKLAVYFSFFNLMTLGEGDLVPTTPGGKTFFCAWALAAIPVMTILVSTSGDFVFSRLTRYEDFTILDAFIDYCINNKYLHSIGIFFKSRQTVSVDKNFISQLKARSRISLDHKNTNDNEKTKVSKATSKKKDLLEEVPIICHPADMLYNIILETSGLNNLDFINSDSFVQSNTATIQLANYFREGESVNPDLQQLHQSRSMLGQQFKEMDHNFDLHEFEQVYDINRSEHKSSVIQTDHKIMTHFKKKNDYVLNKLSRIQIIILELRNAITKICTDINHEYSYEEWEILLKITQNEEALRDKLYWIEDRSPLAFPMHQPKYFAIHYLRHLELFIQQFSAEWDDMPATSTKIKTY